MVIHNWVSIAQQCFLVLLLVQQTLLHRWLCECWPPLLGLIGCMYV